MPGVPESPVAVNEHDVGVARAFQALAGERECGGVDIDGHD